MLSFVQTGEIQDILNSTSTVPGRQFLKVWIDRVILIGILGDSKLIPGFRSPTDRNFENFKKNGYNIGGIWKLTQKVAYMSTFVTNGAKVLILAVFGQNYLDLEQS
jgi:hypothetical protein